MYKFVIYEINDKKYSINKNNRLVFLFFILFKKLTLNYLEHFISNLTIVLTPYFTYLIFIFLM
ncbi:hypothetical protein FC1_16280 [Flavobacterium columnare NBRC 100251 = ATCC 23463]|nr:hypothetical protein FC1_16280 [Flavobacterium columnare NBRC 100251 = ATCC 23463]